MSNHNDAIISRYVNDLAIAKHQLLVTELDRDEARTERDEALRTSAEKDSIIEALKRELEKFEDIGDEPEITSSAFFKDGKL